jgi:hypothetical protein
MELEVRRHRMKLKRDDFDHEDEIQGRQKTKRNSCNRDTSRLSSHPLAFFDAVTINTIKDLGV